MDAKSRPLACYTRSLETLGAKSEGGHVQMCLCPLDDTNLRLCGTDHRSQHSAQLWRLLLYPGKGVSGDLSEE